MSIHVALNHVTHYRYDRPVTLGPQVVRLRPAPHCRTRILSYSLQVEPAEHFINWQQDPQSNYLARLVFPDADAGTADRGGSGRRNGGAQSLRFLPRAVRRTAFRSSTRPTSGANWRRIWSSRRPRPCSPSYLAGISRDRVRTIDFLVELNRRAGARRPLPDPHGAGRAVCRKRRWQGAPAPAAIRPRCWCSCCGIWGWRRASSPVISFSWSPDVKSLDGPAGPGRGFHRPARLVRGVPARRGLDRTGSDLGSAGRRRPHPAGLHARAVGRRRRVSGAVEECETEFEHRMSVQRVWEAPRVTKPYTRSASGPRSKRLGHAIDADLRAIDVRLTMGGEPTFVSVDDPDGAGVEHRGARARRNAGSRRDLYQRLKERYAPAGLAHFGQGKWYPGEQLPRWSLNCFWRKDGEPIWVNPQLIADETQGLRAPTKRPRSAFSRRSPRNWASIRSTYFRPTRMRSTTCGASAACPSMSIPSIPNSRIRWSASVSRKVFEQGSGHGGRLRAAGRAHRRRQPLADRPLVPAQRALLSDSRRFADRATACRWIRCRGPPPTTIRFMHPPDPIANLFARCRRTREIRRQFRERDAVARSRVAARCAAAAEGIGGRDRAHLACAPSRATACCTSSCRRRATLEDYLELIAAVEAAAEALRSAGHPRGLRAARAIRDLDNFKVTPDPGVIEVNVQPSRELG